jgi:hypothetical protein
MSHEHLSAKRGVIDLCTGSGGNHVKLVFAEMARCRLTYRESHTAWARSRPYLRRVSTNVANNMPGHFHITDLLRFICDRVKVVPTHHIHRHPPPGIVASTALSLRLCRMIEAAAPIIATQRSISPNTMSSDPMMAETSASMCPHGSMSIAWR